MQIRQYLQIQSQMQLKNKELIQIRSPKQYLRNLFKQLIQKINKQSQNKKINKKKPLIMDKATKKVVFGLFTIHEIINLGIMVTQNLEVSRQPLDANAIYFIQPKPESVKYVIDDFNVKHNYQYFCVNLVFNGDLPQKVMEEISKQQHLVKRILTFQQFHLNLVFYNSNVCSLDIPLALDFALTHQKVEKIAKNLFIFAISFEIFSYQIHYQANPFCEGIFNVLIQLLKNNKKQSSSQSSEVLTILIVDRMMDPISPLMTSLSYGPMLRDLKRVQNNFILKGEGLNRNIFYFDDSDFIMNKYKNKHFSQVSSALPIQIKQFRQTNNVANFQKGDSVQLKGLHQIKSFNQITNLYNFHAKILEELIDIYKQKKLLKVSEIQNIITSGINDQEVQKTEKQIFVLCYNILTELDQKSEERIRIMILMLMSLNIPKDREAISKSINDYYKKDLVKAINMICPKVMKIKEKRVKENGFLTRHSPKLVSICSNIQLKKQNPGLKMVKLSSISEKGGQEKKIGKSSKPQIPTSIIMMAGPLGWNEISSVEKQGLKSSFYFCCSKVCTPSQYVSEFIKLSQK